MRILRRIVAVGVLAAAAIARAADTPSPAVAKDPRVVQALGEEIVFEMGPDGRATSYTQHSNHYRRVR